jgi:hypothetical protein
MNLHPIYALVIASLMVPAVALALMADRALAAEPQMPESFQGTWCYNERPIPTGVATAAAIRTILERMRHSPNCGIKPDHPGPDRQIEIEITATEVKAIGAFADHTRLEPIPAFPLSCVVRRVTKFDVCPWGMIYKNRERARALRNFQINPWGPGYHIVLQCVRTPKRSETIGTDWLIEKGYVSVGDVPRNYRSLDDSTHSVGERDETWPRHWIFLPAK